MIATKAMASQAPAIPQSTQVTRSTRLNQKGHAPQTIANEPSNTPHRMTRPGAESGLPCFRHSENGPQASHRLKSKSGAPKTILSQLTEVAPCGSRVTPPASNVAALPYAAIARVTRAVGVRSGGMPSSLPGARPRCQGYSHRCMGSGRDLRRTTAPGAKCPDRSPGAPGTTARPGRNRAAPGRLPAGGPPRYPTTPLRDEAAPLWAKAAPVGGRSPPLRAVTEFDGLLIKEFDGRRR